MNVLDSIRNRRSVRTFDGKALSQDDCLRLMEFAETADNPYGIPISWKLLDARSDGVSSSVIVGTDTFIAGKMQRVPHAEEAFGYSFEKIVLFAQSLGIGTTWIAGTMNRTAFEKAMAVSGNEVMPCVSPLGYPAKKMSIREAMMRKAVRADSRIAFGQLFFDGSFDKPLTESGSLALAAPLEAVRLAPSGINRQPWRIVICGDRAHFYEKGYGQGSDWDLHKIDLGIALCHFELVAKESGLDVTFEINDPGLDTRGDAQYIASYVL